MTSTCLLPPQQKRNDSKQPWIVYDNAPQVFSMRRPVRAAVSS